VSVTSANSPTSLTERERNRLLRRVDWRFLLERPVVDRVLCLGSGDLREGCGLIAAQVDDHVIDGGERYDAVVVQDPDDDTLALAFEQLGAAGTLYAEWGAPADRDAVRRRLMTAGFVDVRLYWPWPAPPHAEVWVPLDAPAAFDAYLAADRHVYSGWRHRVGTRARRALARWQLESGHVAPLCAVARTPHAAGAGSGANAPVIQAASTADGVHRGDARLTCALLTGGPRAISKVVGLVYADGEQRPAFVLKWPRVGESEEGLIREADALAACHARVPAAGVPRLLARCGSGAQLAVAETAAHGAPLFTRVSRSAFGPLSRQGASWLADFHDMHRGAPPDTGAWSARAEQAIARFAETFGAVIDARMLEETARVIAHLDHVPTVIEHRDFGPWNILIDDAGALMVLDWESSRVHGLPLLDLIYFITYMAFFVDGAMVSRRFVESYRAMLDPRSTSGAVRAELVQQYRERFDISTGAERALRALCWIEHADSEFQHFTADAGGRPTDDALRASAFVQLWKEEIAALGR
jgi:Ser/Thr protein kinase RdoA (MazF antagonist)